MEIFTTLRIFEPFHLLSPFWLVFEPLHSFLTTYTPITSIFNSPTRVLDPPLVSLNIWMCFSTPGHIFEQRKAIVNHPEHYDMFLNPYTVFRYLAQFSKPLDMFFWHLTLIFDPTHSFLLYNNAQITNFNEFILSSTPTLTKTIWRLCVMQLSFNPSLCSHWSYHIWNYYRTFYWIYCDECLLKILAILSSPEEILFWSRKDMQMPFECSL